MRLYFLRHAESEYNVLKKINGDRAIIVHLTAKGLKQAKAAAKELKPVRFDALYSSPFIRATETAEIIAKELNLPVQTDEHLREINVGFEGKSAKHYHEVLNALGNSQGPHKDGTESFADIKARLLEFLKSVQKTKQARVVVVTHEVLVQAMRAITNELSDADAIATPIPNAKPFVFDF